MKHKIRKSIKRTNNVIEIVVKLILTFTHQNISSQTLIQQIEKGGLKLCHFETKIKSLKLSGVKIVFRK